MLLDGTDVVGFLDGHAVEGIELGTPDGHVGNEVGF